MFSVLAGEVMRIDLAIVLGIICGTGSVAVSSQEDQSFIPCTSGYNKNCEFDGFRTVRMGSANSWSEKQVYGGFPGYQCREYNFATPEGGWGPKPRVCQYSAAPEMELIRQPDDCAQRHDCKDLSPLQMAGDYGSEEELIRKAKTTPDDDSDIGAFRVTCKFSHFAYDDPLVYPNQPGAAHLHAFFGNTKIDDATVTHEIRTRDLRRGGKSTCSGGSANRSAYWIPALLDMNKDEPVIAKEAIFYYKEGYNGLSGIGFENPPVGLSMIGRRYTWQCKDTGSKKYDRIPNCASRITMQVDFPQCWDGENLWKADESHVAYPRNRKCPATHPEPLPQITLVTRYEMTYSGQSKHLMLSSDMNQAPGTSAHADWVNGWKPEISKRFIDNCLNRQRDCHANLLGDGDILY